MGVSVEEGVGKHKGGGVHTVEGWQKRALETPGLSVMCTLPYIA